MCRKWAGDRVLFFLTWRSTVAIRKEWTRDQLITALKLYCELPFGKMHSQNPEIIKYANLIGRTPSALAMKLTNFASLDPTITSSGRKGLSGASQSDRKIWQEMTSNWDHMAAEVERAERGFREVLDENEDEREEDRNVDYTGQTRHGLTSFRVGQRLFRKAVLTAYESRCCISGLAIPELLVASHIVPWQADPSNRLNPRNGLCLSAIHDRAFDCGLISLSDDLRVILSPQIEKLRLAPFVEGAFIAFAGKNIARANKFLPEIEFIRFHRKNLYKA
jgi:predicted restriction endonuclease